MAADERPYFPVHAAQAAQGSSAFFRPRERQNVYQVQQSEGADFRTRPIGNPIQMDSRNPPRQELVTTSQSIPQEEPEQISEEEAESARVHMARTLCKIHRRSRADRVLSLVRMYGIIVRDVRAQQSTPTRLNPRAGHATESRLGQIIQSMPALNTNPEWEGCTPLHCAAQTSRGDLARELLALDASVHVVDARGGTPLHYAAANGAADVIHLLLDAGARVDVKDNEGSTPLHDAVEFGNEVVVMALARGAGHGGSSDAATAARSLNARGQTPAQLAQSLGYSPLAARIADAFDHSPDPAEGSVAPCISLDETSRGLSTMSQNPREGLAWRSVQIDACSPVPSAAVGIAGHIQVGQHAAPQHRMAQPHEIEKAPRYGDRSSAPIQPEALDEKTAGASSHIFRPLDPHSWSRLSLSSTRSTPNEMSVKRTGTLRTLPSNVTESSDADSFGRQISTGEPPLVQMALDRSTAAMSSSTIATSSSAHSPACVTQDSTRFLTPPGTSAVGAVSSSIARKVSAPAGDLTSPEATMSPATRVEAAMNREDSTSDLAEIRDLVDRFGAAAANTRCHAMHGKTPLHCAAQALDASLTRALIQNGADVDAKETLFGSTPLHVAVSSGTECSEIVRALVQTGQARIDERDKYGNTALHIAAAGAMMETARELVNLGASRSILNRGKQTPKEIAIQYMNSSDMVALLKSPSGSDEDEHGVDQSSRSGRRLPRLPPAEAIESVRRVQAAAHKAVRTPVGDAGELSGSSGTHAVRRSEDALHARTMSPRTHSHSSDSSSGSSGSSNSASNSSNSSTSSAGGAANKKTADRRSKHVRKPPPGRRIAKPQESVSQAAASDMETAIGHPGVSSDCDAIMDTVRVHGRSVVNHRARRRGGQTALHRAAFYGRVDTAELLIEYGADVNAKDRQFGSTPAHTAAAKGALEVLKVLLDGGADPNAGSDFGQPLHLAAWYGHLRTVAMLVSRGADIDVQNSDGLTPREVAMQQDHEHVVHLLDRDRR